MKTIRDALVIAWINGWIAATRGWIWVVASSVSPLSFLVLLAIYGGVEGLRWGVLGSLVWTIASNGISLMGDATYYRLGIKYQSMLTAAPVSPIGYAIGLALSAFVFATPTMAFYIAVILWLGVPLASPVAAYALVTLWLASAGLGFTLSSFIRHMKYAWSLPQILAAVFTVGAPVYYPATVLPTPYLGVVVPTGAAGILLQAATDLANYPADLQAAAVLALALQSILGLYLLAKVARWRQQ